VKVLVLTRYSPRGASSRVRTFQYLATLGAHGFDFDVQNLFDDAYLQRLYSGRKTNWHAVIARYSARMNVRYRRRRYDVIWLEKEALPWLPDVAERWLLPDDTPLLVDYDDAIFHRYDAHPQRIVRRLLGDKIDRLMRRARVVTVGSPYLAERAHRAGAADVELLPSAVDVERYRPIEHNAAREFTVGWIGTPQTAHFLLDIRDALRKLAASPSTRFVFVGCPAGLDLGIDYEARTWSESNEVEDIGSFSCGIMPLADEPFERGKCGYKLIQYMACGVPVVASPVGVNTTLVTPGHNGYLASTGDDWLRAFDALRGDSTHARCLGRNGRALVEDAYSTQVNAPRLESALRRASRR
jgi:glycosyltransferase involved in cell wall biosynthesis